MQRIRQSYPDPENFLADLRQVSGFLDQEVRRNSKMAVLRYLIAWLGRTVLASGEPEQIAPEALAEAQSYRDYSVAYLGDAANRPASLSIQKIEMSDASLIREWDSRLIKYPQAWDAAITGRFKGFKLISRDAQGRPHLEGFFTYTEYPGKLGLYAGIFRSNYAARIG